MYILSNNIYNIAVHSSGTFQGVAQRDLENHIENVIEEIFDIELGRNALLDKEENQKDGDQTFQQSSQGSDPNATDPEQVDLTIDNFFVTDPLILQGDRPQEDQENPSEQNEENDNQNQEQGPPSQPSPLGTDPADQTLADDQQQGSQDDIIRVQRLPLADVPLVKVGKDVMTPEEYEMGSYQYPTALAPLFNFIYPRNQDLDERFNTLLQVILPDEPEDDFNIPTGNLPPQFVGFPPHFPDPEDPRLPDDPDPPRLPDGLSLSAAFFDAQTISYDISTSFVDPEGEPLTFAVGSLPDGLSFDPQTGLITGTFDIDASQLNLYQISPGVYVIPITATDPLGQSATGNFVIRVINPLPQAPDQLLSLPEDGFIAVDLLENVSDEDPVSITLFNGQPFTPGEPIVLPEGTYVISPDGVLSYTPNPDYHSEGIPHAVTYTVTDADGGSTVVTLDLLVESEVDIQPDLYATYEDTAITINPITNNDHFESPDAQIIAINGMPIIPDGPPIILPEGTLQLLDSGPNGTLIFTPNPDFHGSVNFEYTVDSPTGISETSTVLIDVVCVDDGQPDMFITDEDTPLIIDVLANDTFQTPPSILAVDNQPITAGGAPVMVANGMVALTLDNTLLFTPNEDYNGPISFTYTVTSNNNTPEVIAVTGHVNPVVDGARLTYDNCDFPEAIIGVEDHLISVDDIGISLADLSQTLLDVDGSESATTITIHVIQDGAPNPDFQIIYQGQTYPGTATITINLDDTNPDFILSGLQIIPPANSDQDATLVFTVPVVDDNANPGGADVTEDTIASIPLIIQADADAPSIDAVPDVEVAFGDATPLNVMVSPSPDHDGSETLTNVMSNIPEGMILLLNGSPLILLPDDSNPGHFQTEPLSEADLEALEVAFAPDAPGGNFQLTLTTTSTETPTELSTPESPQVATESSSVTEHFMVSYEPISVAPVRGLEDQFIALDINQPATPSIDGLQISHIPEGVSIQVGGDITPFVTSMGGSFIYDTQNDVSIMTVSPGQVGSLTLSGAPGDLASFISSLAIRGPEHSDVNFDVNIEVFTSGTSHTFNGVEVAIDPVAEPDLEPLVGQYYNTITEDVWSPVDVWFGTPDVDGSERIELVLSNLPEGTLIGIKDEQGNIIDVSNGGTDYSYAPSDLPGLFFDRDSNVTLNDGHTNGDSGAAVSFEGILYILTPPNYPANNSGTLDELDIHFDFITYDQSTEGVGPNADDDTISIDQDTHSATLDDNLVPITDQITEGYTLPLDEDVMTPLGLANLLSDDDGSESFFCNILLEGLPKGAKLFGENDVLLFEAPYDGAIFMVQAHDIPHMKIQAPLHSDEDFTILATGHNQDSPSTLGNPADILIFQQIPIYVSVNAVADGVTFSNTDTQPGPADAYYDGNMLVPAGSKANPYIALIDDDGSESVTDIRIKDLPDGVELLDVNGAPMGERIGGDYVLFDLDDQVARPWDFNCNDCFYVVWSDRENATDFDYTLTVTTSEVPPYGGLESNLNDNIIENELTLTATIEPVPDQPPLQKAFFGAAANAISDSDETVINIAPLANETDAGEAQHVILEHMPVEWIPHLSSGPAPTYLGSGKWLFSRDDSNADPFAYLNSVTIIRDQGSVESVSLTAIAIFIDQQGNMVGVNRPIDVQFAPGSAENIPLLPQPITSLLYPQDQTAFSKNDSGGIEVAVSIADPSQVTNGSVIQNSALILRNLPDEFIVENGTFFASDLVDGGQGLSNGFWVVNHLEVETGGGDVIVTLTPPEGFTGAFTFDYEVSYTANGFLTNSSPDLEKSLINGIYTPPAEEAQDVIVASVDDMTIDDDQDGGAYTIHLHYSVALETNHGHDDHTFTLEITGVPEDYNIFRIVDNGNASISYLNKDGTVTITNLSATDLETLNTDLKAQVDGGHTGLTTLSYTLTAFDDTAATDKEKVAKVFGTLSQEVTIEGVSDAPALNDDFAISGKADADISVGDLTYHLSDPQEDLGPLIINALSFDDDDDDSTDAPDPNILVSEGGNVLYSGSLSDFNGANIKPENAENISLQSDTPGTYEFNIQGSSMDGTAAPATTSFILTVSVTDPI